MNEGTLKQKSKSKKTNAKKPADVGFRAPRKTTSKPDPETCGRTYSKPPMRAVTCTCTRPKGHDDGIHVGARNGAQYVWFDEPRKVGVVARAFAMGLGVDAAELVADRDAVEKQRLSKNGKAGAAVRASKRSATQRVKDGETVDSRDVESEQNASRAAAVPETSAPTGTEPEKELIAPVVPDVFSIGKPRKVTVGAHVLVRGDIGEPSRRAVVDRFSQLGDPVVRMFKMGHDDVQTHVLESVSRTIMREDIVGVVDGTTNAPLPDGMPADDLTMRRTPEKLTAGGYVATGAPAADTTPTVDSASSEVIDARDRERERPLQLLTATIINDAIAGESIPLDWQPVTIEDQGNPCWVVEWVARFWNEPSRERVQRALVGKGYQARRSERAPERWLAIIGYAPRPADVEQRTTVSKVVREPGQLPRLEPDPIAALPLAKFVSATAVGRVNEMTPESINRDIDEDVPPIDWKPVTRQTFTIAWGARFASPAHRDNVSDLLRFQGYVCECTARDTEWMIKIIDWQHPAAVRAQSFAQTPAPYNAEQKPINANHVSLDDTPAHPEQTVRLTNPVIAEPPLDGETPIVMQRQTTSRKKSSVETNKQAAARRALELGATSPGIAEHQHRQNVEMGTAIAATYTTLAGSLDPRTFADGDPRLMTAQYGQERMRRAREKMAREEQSKPELGVPAHDTSRLEDERRRRDDAMAKARENADVLDPSRVTQREMQRDVGGVTHGPVDEDDAPWATEAPVEERAPWE